MHRINLTEFSQGPGFVVLFDRVFRLTPLEALKTLVACSFEASKNWLTDSWRTLFDRGKTLI
jgi:hypothetical protein